MSRKEVGEGKGVMNLILLSESFAKSGLALPNSAHRVAGLIEEGDNSNESSRSVVILKRGLMQCLSSNQGTGVSQVSCSPWYPVQLGERGIILRVFGGRSSKHALDRFVL